MYDEINTELENSNSVQASDDLKAVSLSLERRIDHLKNALESMSSHIEKEWEVCTQLECENEKLEKKLEYEFRQSIVFEKDSAIEIQGLHKEIKNITNESQHWQNLCEQEAEKHNQIQVGLKRTEHELHKMFRRKHGVIRAVRKKNQRELHRREFFNSMNGTHAFPSQSGVYILQKYQKKAVRSKKVHRKNQKGDKENTSCSMNHRNKCDLVSHNCRNSTTLSSGRPSKRRKCRCLICTKNRNTRHLMFGFFGLR